MNRSCFICESNNLEIIQSSIWPLPGVGEKNIGFSICKRCGAVSQSPTAAKTEMDKYYESIAVYTNPGRQGEPTINKKNDVNEQIKFITRGLGKLPSTVMQIGSSDGFTLSRFKEHGCSEVIGIEPCISAAKLAKEKYGITCIASTIENIKTEKNFELILLTHVMEHLYTPADTLNKCYKMQPENGAVYVEVPLMSNLIDACPGFFSFEHINYYTRENLLFSLRKANYKPISIIEHMESNACPIIGVLAKKQTTDTPFNLESEYHTNKHIAESYLNSDKKYWQSILDKAREELSSCKRLFIWGAGGHTSQLISNTSINDDFNICGLIDSSSSKWGVIQGRWTCQSPKDVYWRKGDGIILSTYASETELYNSLEWARELGVITIKLHNVKSSKSIV